MFLNCKFIRCYIKSMFDYFLGMQKAQILWNNPVPFHVFCWTNTEYNLTSLLLLLLKVIITIIYF